MSYILIFTLGLLAGSFINAYVHRLRSGGDILMGRSRCPSCGHFLNQADLIPLVSWFLLRGRCRYCGEPISSQYPLVEFATAVLFVLFFWAVLNGGGGIAEDFGGRYWFLLLASSPPLLLEPSLAQYFLTLLFLCVNLIWLEAIFLYDLKFGLIPNRITVPAMLTTLVWQFVRFLVGGYSGSSLALMVVSYLGAGLAAAGFFTFLHLLTKGKGMGAGDVKLALLMGFLLGFPAVIMAIYLAVLAGALISLLLLLLGRKRFGQTIPFGPFLVGGTVLTAAGLLLV